MAYRIDQTERSDEYPEQHQRCDGLGGEEKCLPRGQQGLQGNQAFPPGGIHSSN